MIALPEGITVYAGGREWTGEIPDELCPADLKPAPSVAVGKAKSAPAQDAPDA